MEGRYKLLSEWPGVRNIEQYNAAIRDPKALAEVREKLGEKLKAGADGAIAPMPYIVIVIDELADLMMTAPREIEESVARLAQKARAVGIHLILATQRPSVDVITGTIKANLPCRIAYTTRTKIDSRTILDAVGAETLLGQGDMLFLAPGTSYLMRVHGGFISGDETKEICRFLKKQAKADLRRERHGRPGGRRRGGAGRPRLGGRRRPDVRPGGAPRRARADGVDLLPPAPARDRLLARGKADRHDAARRHRRPAGRRREEPRGPRRRPTTSRRSTAASGKAGSSAPSAPEAGDAPPCRSVGGGQLAGEKVSHARQLEEESVVPAKRADLPEGGARPVCPVLHVARRVEDVAGNPDAGEPPAEGAERAGDAAPAAADVVRVHGVEEREIARRVEAGDELLAVPRQVRLDGERLVRAGLSPEACSRARRASGT